MTELDVRIVDPKTKCEALPGEIGEIWLAGPSVASGYWQFANGDNPFQSRLKGTEHEFLNTGKISASFVTSNCSLPVAAKTSLSFAVRITTLKILKKPFASLAKFCLQVSVPPSPSPQRTRSNSPLFSSCRVSSAMLIPAGLWRQSVKPFQCNTTCRCTLWCWCGQVSFRERPAAKSNVRLRETNWNSGQLTIVDRTVSARRRTPGDYATVSSLADTEQLTSWLSSAVAERTGNQRRAHRH